MPGFTQKGRINMYRDDFEEMIKDWQADHAPEYDDLEIDDINFEDGRWIAVAHDKEHTYQLSDEGGDIIINYLGTR
jgi:hypothetical protein